MLMAASRRACPQCQLAAFTQGCQKPGARPLRDVKNPPTSPALESCNSVLWDNPINSKRPPAARTAEASTAEMAAEAEKGPEAMLSDGGLLVATVAAFHSVVRPQSQTGSLKRPGTDLDCVSTLADVVLTPTKRLQLPSNSCLALS